MLEIPLKDYPSHLARLVFFLLFGWLVYICLAQASGVLSMLFISLLAAYVLDPLVDWCETKGLNRSAAIGVLVLVAIGFTGLFLIWMVPVLIGEFAEIGLHLKDVFSRDPAEMIAWVNGTFGVELDADTAAELKRKGQEHLPQAAGYVGKFLQGVGSRTMGVVASLLNVVMIPIFVFYFLRDFDHMKAWVVDHIPAKYRDVLLKRGRKVDNVVGEWLRGQVEVALIMACLYAFGLWLVGIKLAIPIGILAGLLNVIPYLGFACGIGMALLMTILEWQGLWMVGGVFAVFVLVQKFESYVLTPKIVGEKVGLSPVTVLIVLLLGGELFGLIGFLLSVPVAGAVKTIANEFLDWYRNSEHYQAFREPPAEAPAE